MLSDNEILSMAPFELFSIIHKVNICQHTILPAVILMTKYAENVVGVMKTSLMYGIVVALGVLKIGVGVSGY